MAEQDWKIEKLYHYMIDMLLEQELKLGYYEEALRLYYPRESLIHILEIEENPAELQDALRKFADTYQEKLGSISFRDNEGRYCILIPAAGIRYVHEHAEHSPFLQEFIDCMRDGHATIEELRSVFQKYSDHVSFEKVDHGEFDYVLFFEDGIPDEYRYCISMHGAHAIYHRFNEQDYVELGL